LKISDEDNNIYKIPEDVQGDVHVNIGIVTLLQKSKFKQYRGLIECCQYGEFQEGKAVLPMDLEGFWAICMNQVDKALTKFGQLEKLEKTNFVVEKVLTSSNNVKKIPVKKPAVSTGIDKAKIAKRNQAAKDRMAAFKRAMQEKNKQAANENTNPLI